MTIGGTPVATEEHLLTRVDLGGRRITKNKKKLVIH